MRYTKPTILNDSKATPLITSQGIAKRVPLFEAPPSTQLSDASAYEADE